MPRRAYTAVAVRGAKMDEGEVEPESQRSAANDVCDGLGDGPLKQHVTQVHVVTPEIAQRQPAFRALTREGPAGSRRLADRRVNDMLQPSQLLLPEESGEVHGPMHAVVGGELTNVT